MGRRGRRRAAKSSSKGPHWLVVVIVGAILAPVFTLIISPATGRKLQHALHPGHGTSSKASTTTPADLIARVFLEQTKSADLWERTPIVFKSATIGFTRNFDLLDPRTVHPPDFKSAAAVSELVNVATLVQRAPLYGGKLVVVPGKVLAWNVVSPAKYPVDLLVQVADVHLHSLRPRDVGAIVYCRIPVPSRSQIPYHGQTVALRGLVVAAGAVSLATGGFRPAVYLAGSSIGYVNKR